jgi:transposase
MSEAELVPEVVVVRRRRSAEERPLIGKRRWLSRKSDTAAAIRYALSRWTALTRYVDDGALEIDNNAAERALRVVAVGRKNYLSARSDAGG